MKAVLLSAGKGERLGSLTQDTSKCLLPVGNKSMLEHWFYILSIYKVTDVLVNLHHCADKVINHCSKIIPKTDIRTSFIYEKELLGSAKTVFNNRDFVKSDRYFLIIYTDTWMQIDLKKMYGFQKKHKGMGSIGLYKTNDLSDQGVVKVKGRKILSFEEKPKDAKDGFAFAGIMIGCTSMFRFYEDSMQDLSKDWLPKIKSGLNPFFIDGLVLDIGTPERYKSANEQIRNLGLKAL